MINLVSSNSLKKLKEFGKWLLKHEFTSCKQYFKAYMRSLTLLQFHVSFLLQFSFAGMEEKQQYSMLKVELCRSH